MPTTSTINCLKSHFKNQLSQKSIVLKINHQKLIISKTISLNNQPQKTNNSKSDCLKSTLETNCLEIPIITNILLITMELHKNTHHVHCISITLSFSIFYHISGQAFFYILLLLLMFFFILFLLFQLLLFFFFFSQKNLFSPLHFIPISSHPTSPLLFLLCSLPVFFLSFLCHLFFLLFFISHYKKHIDCGWLFFAEVYITTTTLSSCGHLTSPININTMH